MPSKDIWGEEFSLEWEWVVTATPRTLCPWKKEGVPVLQEVGWASGPAQKNPEKLPPPGFEPRAVKGSNPGPSSP